MEQRNVQQEQAEPAASVLRRKARVGQAEHQARSMTLPKAFRVSLAKVADSLFDMAMAVIGVRRQTCTAEGLEKLFDEKNLLLLLEHPAPRRAAAVFDATLVGGLIQQQTMGKVMPPPGEETRKLTATDAAICAPFLDALLERAASLPEEEALRHLIEGYRFGAHSDEPRLMMMALDEPAYEVFHLTVDMAKGARQGQIILCFPAAPEAPHEGSAKPGETREGGTGSKVSQMERTVLGLNVELNVALSRIRLPLSELQAFKVDDVLDLKVSSFDKCVVQTREGRRLSSGTLGQIDGVRAVQLEHGGSPFNAPRRRASDRPDLNLPVVSGDGTGAKPAGDLVQLPDMPLPDMPMSAAPAEMAGLPDLPDMGALPDLPEGADLPEMPDLPGSGGDANLPDLADLPELPDLPDMSDLPDFAEEEDSPEMTIT